VLLIDLFTHTYAYRFINLKKKDPAAPAIDPTWLHQRHMLRLAVLEHIFVGRQVVVAVGQEALLEGHLKDKYSASYVMLLMAKSKS
jgi:hypothetical protein